LAHSKSAKKSIRIMKERRSRNRAVTSAVKTSVGRAQKLLEGKSKELESAKEAVKQAAIALDKAAQKGIIHKKNAARRKSRLTKKLNAVPTPKSKS
jgi:small subunit ribosomal protein S20